MKHQIRHIVVLFTLAFVVRLITVSIFGSYIVSDAVEYNQIATNLYLGKGFKDEDNFKMYRPPLYPLFLGLLYKLSKKNVQAVWIAQGLLSVLTTVVIYLLALEWSGKDKKVSFITGLLFALYPDFNLYCLLLYSETIALFFLYLAILFLNRKQVISSGISFGLSTLTRFETVLLGVWLSVFKGIKKEWKNTFTITLLILVTLLPWWIRNFSISGKFILAPTNSGVNLWIGNHIGATGGYHFPKDKSVNQLINENLSEIEKCQLGYKLTFHFIKTHTKEAGKLIFRKFCRFLAPLPEHDLNGIYVKSKSQSTNDRLISRYFVWIISPVCYSLLYIAGVSGLVFGCAHKKINKQSKRFILSILLYFLIINLVYFSVPRFRLSVLPLLMFGAGYLIVYRQEYSSKFFSHPLTTAGKINIFLILIHWLSFIYIILI